MGKGKVSGMGKGKDVREKRGRDIGEGDREGDREREVCKKEGGEMRWWGWGKGRIGHWGREVWGMGKGDRDIWDKHIGKDSPSGLRLSLLQLPFYPLRVAK